jgi:CheY-like chemotaxis protein
MKKILIVDDIAELVDIVIEFLTEAGFLCLTARSVDEAKDILSKNVIDLIFVDWYMDMKYGIELLKFIRERYGNLPVVLMASANEGALWKALGFSGYLPKPVRNFSDIVNIAHKLLKEE